MERTRDTASVAEAAALLGRSETVVLRRLKKGTLAGEKIRTETGEVWQIDLASLAEAAELSLDQVQERIGGGALPMPVADLDSLPSVVDERFQRLEAGFAELRGALAGEWVTEMRQAQEQAADRIGELTDSVRTGYDRQQEELAELRQVVAQQTEQMTRQNTIIEQLTAPRWYQFWRRNGG